MSKAIVTGAAGFIGSYLVDALLERGDSVVGVDNFSTGSLDNLRAGLGRPSFRMEKLDLRGPIGGRLPADAEVVYHLAADPEVRTGLSHPESQYESNVQATYNILEFVRKAGIKKLYLASSSTVYGEPKITPTPEDYCPLVPISIYGCSKLVCEILALGYAQAFGIQTIILRPANVVGGRGTHGVLLDFIAKLKSDPNSLKILGNGTQAKSYLHATDVVEAVLAIDSKSSGLQPVEVFNIGNVDKTSVMRIAELVSQEMGLAPSYSLSGGIEGGRAWRGDVMTVLLAIDKIRGVGWVPRWSSDESVRRSVVELLAAEA